MNSVGDGRIVVLGGGPAGLAVARLLRLRGLDPLVLERDSGPGARTQGGSLDLTEDGGLRAVREMGLADAFAELCRPNGQAVRLFDTQARPLLDVVAADFGEFRPEIDRVVLRRLMLDALPSESVRWSSTVTAVRPTGERGYRVELADGTRVPADLVIGCDGIGSRARPLRTDQRPRYCGSTFIRGDIRHPDPASFVSQGVGEGAMFVIGMQRAVLAQRNGDGSIHLYVALRTEDDPRYRRGRSATDEPATRAWLRGLLKGWSPEVRDILDQVDDGFSYWPLYTVSARQSWVPRGDVTLVGDAAHVMPPFTGQGVNMALLDAVQLVAALTDGRRRSVEEALVAYETAMLDRMAGMVTAANAAADAVLSADGPATLLASFAAAG